MVEPKSPIERAAITGMEQDSQLTVEQSGDQLDPSREGQAAELVERLKAEREATVGALESLRVEMGLDAGAGDSVALPARILSVSERLLGDFADVARTPDGLLILPDAIRAEVQTRVDQQVRVKQFSLPSLASGAPTATRYDSKAQNFSTRTAILQLENGQRVFSVYNYKLSQLHRWFDRGIKELAGHRRHKVSSARWKGKFEGKSRIPTMQNEHPDVVLLPYIPNMNAFDLFRHNHTMKDHGELPWAKELGVEEKTALGEKIIAAIAAIHEETGGGWGETILNNVIVTPEGEPIIVDPEVEYNAGVSPEEQKMDDLKEIVYSMAGAISNSETGVDTTAVVHRFLQQYPDQSLVKKLSDGTSTKFNPLRRIQLLLHDLGYFKVSFGQYRSITEAIASYQLAS